MTGRVATLDLALRRRSIIGYSVGMAVYVIVVVALYPSFKDATNLDSLTKDSPGVAALFGISGSLTSPTGWLDANIYANFFPLLLLLLTIGYGSWCIAGQERDGHLELVMALPFPRGQVLLQKIAALVGQAMAFSAVVLVSCLLGRAFELSVDAVHLSTATLGVTLLGIDLGLVALGIGATTGQRGPAIAITTAIAAASYLVSSMAPLVDWLRPLRYASLFYWSVGDGQLDRGLSIADLGVLLAAGVLVGAWAYRAFLDHDLATT
jgi:ABC-2 type transport system permease protein